MFQFFPGNYTWTAAVLRVLYTGGTIGEVARAVGSLQEAARAWDVEAWFQAWRELGDHVWEQGERQLAERHSLSGADSFFRACGYYQWAEIFIPFEDPRRADTHQRSVDAFARFAENSVPVVERVELPYQDTSLPAWFVPGAGPEPRKPTISFMPGLDSTKEQAMALAQVVSARGFNLLLVDGPGVGESVLFRGLVNRPDEEVAGRAHFDYLSARPDVDPARIGLVGLSMGGYRAPRTAAFEPRCAALVCWGAMWDFGAYWRDRLLNDSGYASTRNDHVLFVMGAETPEQVTEKVQRWNLEGVAERIQCPTLILHGERDAQIPLDQAERMYAAIGSSQKELKVFTEEEGGSSHCQNDNRLLAHAYIADWLEDTLLRDKRRQAVVRGSSGTQVASSDQLGVGQNRQSVAGGQA